ncbi:uncharacterized protein TRIADDRAFT_62579 [Trichoplax adhaerens]|uniref:Uncharacterized protein n=1 Tax=Trichoplax adhaerens TaxID=10228 RepID=B3SE81_TRIAD|nr:predicted protein [Trichoplax adhaerens]EDV18966.1 predicted protein [Trichoplax adhaerens]|eukprot:XP_002118550.1 predicted protein [Trichoplax adhaerens]
MDLYYDPWIDIHKIIFTKEKMNSKLVVLASLLLIIVVCSAKEDQAKQNTDDDKEQYDFAITSRMEKDDGDVVRFNKRDQEIEELKEDLQHLKKAVSLRIMIMINRLCILLSQ